MYYMIHIPYAQFPLTEIHLPFITERKQYTPDYHNKMAYCRPSADWQVPGTAAAEKVFGTAPSGAVTEPAKLKCYLVGTASGAAVATSSSSKADLTTNCKKLPRQLLGQS
jgi:hypothetical protein